MSYDRSWMYSRFTNRFLSQRFVAGVEEFLDFAFSQHGIIDKIKCPCIDCNNIVYLERDAVKYHLYRRGFTVGYTAWTVHGEELIGNTSKLGESSSAQDNTNYNIQTMEMDAMGPRMYNTFSENNRSEPEEHEPNAEPLEEADRPLWPDCIEHTKLSAMSQLLKWKSEYNLPAGCYDRLMSISKDMLPEDDHLEDTFYKKKRMLSNPGLDVVKIDACFNDCMLYYNESEDLTECSTCRHPRYKDTNSKYGCKIAHKVLQYLPLTHRLQKLYMSKRTAQHMTWHVNNGFTHGEMSHPVHGEAWKHFDRTHPNFSLQPRNVRLGLCTDGFNPFGMTSSQYFCWPVITTVYNLPPGMCMQRENMFLSMVIPGPKSPGKNIDVYLRPLVDEFKMLWNEGVETYDIHTKKKFQMRAALLWTISDFPGFGMLSGWSTHGPLSCPYCMGNTKSFMLKNGQKCSFFDCHRQFLPPNHPFRKQNDKFFKGRIEKDEAPTPLTGEQLRRIVDRLPNVMGDPTIKRQHIEGFGLAHNWVKRSIFWELPYWCKNLIRHNLDVMHIEKNVFENIFNTVMDVKGKTKDNFKARKDLEHYCHRSELHIVEQGTRFYKPKASYSLTKDQKKMIYYWIKSLRMPDGYASNIARCVKGDDDFYGMNSHDCHIFMQRLIPIAFKELLTRPIWEALTELSHFFRDMCSVVVKVDDVKRLEENIIIIICKLEKIFPPAFFDSMEHLLIHLPYEARVGGPVQYRWMYPFKRYLNHLKRKVKNRSSVEGSIVEAYLVEETSTFCSLYFDDTIQTRLNHPPRNDDGCLVDPLGRLSIFTNPGRPLGKQIGNVRKLTDDEYEVASRYVLRHCEDAAPFLEKFAKQMRKDQPQLSDEQLYHLCDDQFPSWLREYVMHTNNELDHRIVQLGMGPSRVVKYYNGYFVNGFEFHTLDYGRYKKTMNSGVCVLGSCFSECAPDYYGLLNEILELEYYGRDNNVVLFKWDWFDNEHGVRVDQQFNLVEVNHKTMVDSLDKFVLSQQAQQVYFTNIPTKGSDKDWWVVVKTKARHLTCAEGNISGDETCDLHVELAFQEDQPQTSLRRIGLSLELDVQPLVQVDENLEETYNDEDIDSDHVIQHSLEEDRNNDDYDDEVDIGAGDDDDMDF